MGRDDNLCPVNTLATSRNQPTKEASTIDDDDESTMAYGCRDPAAVLHVRMYPPSAKVFIAPFGPPPPFQRMYRGAAPPPLCSVVPEVRGVFAVNIDYEFSLLASLLRRYPEVHVDTEFPGTIYDSETSHYIRRPRENYALIKKNVDELKLLQVGIALSGPAGRCPVAWQFNLRGFDVHRDPHAAASVAMLRDQGMMFSAMQSFGVDPDAFAAGFFRCGLGDARRLNLTWAAFSGSYDFAYLLKVLRGGRPLPDTVEEFVGQVHMLFGPRVFDVKHLARFCGDGGIRGGLDDVAAKLGVERAAGRAHCAGSDSMLSCDVFRAMMTGFFRGKNMFPYSGAIVGLV